MDKCSHNHCTLIWRFNGHWIIKPARHSKLEKADILEMTVKHLQDVQKRQLSTAMIADPAVLRKFRGGFEECASEVSNYIDSLEGISPGVRRRLAAHLSSCVSNIPASRSEDTNNNNNNNSVNAISASLRLIPSRLPNGDLALLVPDAQSLPGNVLPFFQLAEHCTKVGQGHQDTNMAPNIQHFDSKMAPSVGHYDTKMMPNVGHYNTKMLDLNTNMGLHQHCGLNQVSTTSSEKLPDTLRLDSHPSAFTAVNKHASECTTSPTSSLVSPVSSSSAERQATMPHHPNINNMSPEVSSTSEQLTDSGPDPSSSSFNSSTSSNLSPQNNQPQPSTETSPKLEGIPQDKHTFHYTHQDNRVPEPSTLMKILSTKTIIDHKDVSHNPSQKHQDVPKFSYPDFPKNVADDVSRFSSSQAQDSMKSRPPQTEYTYMDALRIHEPFGRQQEGRYGKRPMNDPNVMSEFSLPLTIDTNLNRGASRRLTGNVSDSDCLPTPINFSKNVTPMFQNGFVPSLKRRRLEVSANFGRNGSSGEAELLYRNGSSSEPVGQKEVQSFSPQIIQQERSSAEDVVQNGGSEEASGKENMWRPW
ncbi:uncharacterized protein LOC111048901 isoform X2 [Nilaparvata lugens]|uniref:uncharacterized protein LOC111048901 isoform X2 n=1 Tax=Nilaparvata lugens TaxID=108931 RepID=UPI00193E535D|nr:uncharacterized protein LOC111048901 isoform X2 [Nilaparvata lugens]